MSVRPKITVYTVITNGYDNLRPPANDAWDKSGNTRYVCVTNVPSLPWCPPWEYVPCYAPFDSPSRNSRTAKILPHLYFDTEYSIYLDGYFVLNMNPNEIVAETLRESYDIALHKHFSRRNVWDEFKVVDDLVYADPEQVFEQRLAYMRRDYPSDPVTAPDIHSNGFIVRRHNENTRQLNDSWWHYYMRGTERDQLSLPLALWKCGFLDEANAKIGTIQYDILKSPYIGFCFHPGERGDNPTFEPERKVVRDKVIRLRELCGSNDGRAPKGLYYR